MSQDISRKEFFRRLFRGAGDKIQEVVDTAVESSQAQRASRQPGREPVRFGKPRPPWALAEAEFLEACTKCHQCVTLCPERVIQVYFEGVDQRFMGTPILNLSYGHCTFCGECVRACDPGALDFERGMQVQAMAAVRQSCLAIRGQNCRDCEQSCPHEALHFGEGDIPVINAARCLGCGACALSCWGGHIEILKRVGRRQTNEN